MADEKSEEFRRFILENRELIENILKEAEEGTEKELKDEFEKKTDKAKEKAKDTGEALLQIISDENVQKHFVTGVLEFLHFFEAVIEAAPLSPEVREAVDKLNDTKESTIKNVVSVAAKDRMENMKDCTDSPKPKSAKKPESIKINVKDSKKTTKKV